MVFCFKEWDSISYACKRRARKLDLKYLLGRFVFSLCLPVFDVVQHRNDTALQINAAKGCGHLIYWIILHRKDINLKTSTNFYLLLASITYPTAGFVSLTIFTKFCNSQYSFY